MSGYVQTDKATRKKSADNHDTASHRTDCGFRTANHPSNSLAGSADGLNRSARMQPLLQFRQALDRSPRVQAQLALQRTLNPEAELDENEPVQAKLERNDTRLISPGVQKKVAQRVVNFRQMTGEITQPDSDQILRWLSQGGYERTDQLAERVQSLVAHPEVFTVDWAYGQASLMRHLNDVFGPMAAYEQAVGAKMTSSRQIAGAYLVWLQKWAPNGPHDEQSQQTLRDHWSEAADHLEALLRHVGIDPRPGDMGARRNNQISFPNLSPLWLQDMLTVLGDLRTFGPSPTFRPVQTIETVEKWARTLSR